MGLQPGSTVERYRVDAVLGEGGMAVVYRVTHTTLGTSHALKVLSLTRGDIRDRLIQEGRVQAGLRHANVVSVTDVLDAQGAPSLLMEMIEGPSLDRWLAEHRPSLDEALALFRGVVAGVAHAHAAGLIHRDLKPANVLLDTRDGALVPKVTDFGLAKVIDGDTSGDLAGRTRSGATMGTPAYMAPEQIRNARDVDARADLFSLGCMLYELCIGRPPYRGDSVVDLFNAILAGEHTPPREARPDLPPEVVAAIEGLLVVDPERRLPSCEALLAVLDGPPAPSPPAETLPSAGLATTVNESMRAAPSPPPQRARAAYTGVVAWVAGATSAGAVVLGCFGVTTWLIGSALAPAETPEASLANPPTPPVVTPVVRPAATGRTATAPPPVVGGGVRPLDDDSVGICVRKPPWGCRRFVGRSATDLPNGDYILFGSFAVPDDDRDKRWSVTLDYTCTPTSGAERHATPVHKVYRIVWPGRGRGYEVGMVPFTQPAATPVACTYTISMPGPAAPRIVQGSWKTRGR